MSKATAWILLLAMLVTSPLGGMTLRADDLIIPEAQAISSDEAADLASREANAEELLEVRGGGETPPHLKTENTAAIVFWVVIATAVIAILAGSAV